MYKIVAKVLSKQIREVIDSVVSDGQCAFMKGRQFFDRILVANKIIHSIKKNSSSGGSLILKLDLVLFHIGFWVKWRGWISKCVSTAKSTILVNGLTTNEFRISRGLKQEIQFLHFCLF